MGGGGGGGGGELTGSGRCVVVGDSVSPPPPPPTLHSRTFLRILLENLATAAAAPRVALNNSLIGAEHTTSSRLKSGGCLPPCSVISWSAMYLWEE